MAVLADADRAKIWRGLQRFLSTRGDTFPYVGLTRADGRAAVDGIDDGLNSVLTTLNASFPEPFRSLAGADLKALFVCVNAAYRVDGTGEFAKGLFGGLE